MTSEPPVEKIFISANSLLRDSMELAMNVLRSGFRPTFLVAIWRGGAPIGITVQEVLEYHGVIVDHIHDRLLLIDDVFDSGRSLEAVMNELRQRCRRNLPSTIRIATVYYKPARNRSSLTPDYFIKSTDTWLVFPHEIQGLSREEILANKPVDARFFELE
jgi:hypoxanthine phosphoribosyltransferase